MTDAPLRPETIAELQAAASACLKDGAYVYSVTVEVKRAGSDDEVQLVFRSLQSAFVRKREEQGP